ncbi:hypothetical protein [Burkholderia sp. FERM BP-3421]|jgi:hypothetical protein|uniref:hypothetical protein n=1 Tax=Burkholderia sp. FERM BP-3421 TaxID=1494466 RepID=UPI002361FE96|nr:hypothetical protein [Burkholderia sp. FERM BP-3421]
MLHPIRSDRSSPSFAREHAEHEPREPRGVSSGAPGGKPTTARSGSIATGALHGRVAGRPLGQREQPDRARPPPRPRTGPSARRAALAAERAGVRRRAIAARITLAVAARAANGMAGGQVEACVIATPETEAMRHSKRIQIRPAGVARRGPRASTATAPD